jgi:hypothetical protein
MHSFGARQAMIESFCSIHATCPAHITFLNLIIQVVLYEEYNPRSFSLFVHSSEGDLIGPNTVHSSVSNTSILPIFLI